MTLFKLNFTVVNSASSVIGFSSYTIFVPTLAPILRKRFGYREDVVSEYFLAYAFGIVSASFFMRLFIKYQVAPRKAIETAFIIIAVGLLIAGPSDILLLDKILSFQNIVMLFGLYITGIGAALTNHMPLWESKEYAIKLLPDYDPQLLMDYISSYNSLNISASEAIGSILGAYCYEKIGFSKMCDLFSFVQLSFCLIHFTCYKLFNMYTVNSCLKEEKQV